MRQSESRNARLFSGANGNSFRKTAYCKVRPDVFIPNLHPLACPDLSDDEIDQALDYALGKSGGVEQLPRTQYGRRVAVASFLAYERTQPVHPGITPPTPFRPSQPR